MPSNLAARQDSPFSHTPVNQHNHAPLLGNLGEMNVFEPTILWLHPSSSRAQSPFMPNLARNRSLTAFLSSETTHMTPPRLLDLRRSPGALFLLSLMETARYTEWAFVLSGDWR